MLEDQRWIKIDELKEKIENGVLTLTIQAVWSYCVIIIEECFFCFKWCSPILTLVLLTDILCAYCIEEGWYIYCIEHGAMNAVKSKPFLMTICWRFMPLLNSLKLRPTNSLWRHHLLGFRVLLWFSYIYWYAFKWCGCMINKMAWLLILLFSPSFTLIFCKMWYSFFWKIWITKHWLRYMLLVFCTV